MTNEEIAFGWRPVADKTSAGLDFLGLASPIEGILDVETEGITNATERARYFSIMPWIYWKYAKQGGQGSKKDQRHFTIGFEQLLAYANIASVETTGQPMTGIIRRDECERNWKKDLQELPLRGDVGETPSPLDAALYGPSLRRFNLLSRVDHVHGCANAGRIIAEELDKTFGQLEGKRFLLTADTVKRSTVHVWAECLSLDKPVRGEKRLLRSLLFSTGEFDSGTVPSRVKSMLLLLSLAAESPGPFTTAELETCLATGMSPIGSEFTPDARLQETWTRWRIMACLKYLRHASELGFAAVHSFVTENAQAGSFFPTAESAAIQLCQEAVSGTDTAVSIPAEYQKLVQQFSATTPYLGWEPQEKSAVNLLRHAIQLVAWCHSLLSSPVGLPLLGHKAATIGFEFDADLSGWYGHFDRLKHHSTFDVLRWLTVDRGVARHFRVAARKLVQHDTFRLIEDERGVHATDNCPVAGIAIRIGAMLSLMSDVGLLNRESGGYMASAAAAGWLKKQLSRLP